MRSAGWSADPGVAEIAPGAGAPAWNGLKPMRFHGVDLRLRRLHPRYFQTRT